ncbi:hypothetical protein [Paracidovorax konjaci]|uniref:Uncharacterized protein n=1 Tax=Paracidovorax konjaci TaxID=32040 RepID=A0A1I1XQ07_9BURK|nr:hypothetical protein [Paracidovorax konjaci]SFE09416.1 hypothetical protein SAMN04489710_11447 [Paracidovorax konjaci]
MTTPGTTTPALAAQRDALLQVAIDFIGTLTGMTPPPIETAPPEVFAPFHSFVDRVQAIVAVPADPQHWAQNILAVDLSAFEKARFGVFNPDGRFEEIPEGVSPCGWAESHPCGHTARWVGGPRDLELLRAALASAGHGRMQLMPDDGPGWKSHAEAMERERYFYRQRMQTMQEHQDGDVWYGQDDGEDHLESMVNSLPVVIRADQLRALLAASGKVA